MKGFRLFLESQGLSENDIEEAIEQSRRVTKLGQAVAGSAVALLTKLASQAKDPRIAKGLVTASVFAAKVEAGAASMLRSARVEAPPPPRAPSPGT
jgi:hypothetical protein